MPVGIKKPFKFRGECSCHPCHWLDIIVLYFAKTMPHSISSFIWSSRAGGIGWWSSSSRIIWRNRMTLKGRRFNGLCRRATVVERRNFEMVKHQVWYISGQPLGIRFPHGTPPQGQGQRDRFSPNCMVQRLNCTLITYNLLNYRSIILNRAW